MWCYRCYGIASLCDVGVQVWCGRAAVWCGGDYAAQCRACTLGIAAPQCRADAAFSIAVLEFVCVAVLGWRSASYSVAVLQSRSIDPLPWRSVAVMCLGAVCEVCGG